MTPQQHRPSPFVALVAGASFGLWLVVSAGLNTAATHPMSIPQPPTSATLEVSPAAPMPSPGAEATIEVR